MKVESLQQFLRDISGPFASLGIASQSLGGLAACADALTPFKGMEFSNLADFLRRAEEARQSGTVPLVEVAELAPVSTHVRKLGEDVEKVAHASGDQATELERDINRHRHQLQSAITDLAQLFGIVVKSSEVPDWVSVVRARKMFGELKSRITSPASYTEPEVEALISKLADMGDPVLKQATTEHEVPTTRRKGRQIVEDILAKTTSHKASGGRTASPRVAKKNTVDQTAVDAMAEEVRKAVDGAKENPYALTDEEIEGLIARVKKVPSKSQQHISMVATGSAGKNGPDAVLRIRSALASVKQNLEGQKV